MGALRQILAQSRKRIGLLVGAGAPASIRYDTNTGRIDENAQPLIPTIHGLIIKVLGKLGNKDSAIIALLCKDLGADYNIETILSRVRSCAGLVGSCSMYGCNAKKFAALGKLLCNSIGNVVSAALPTETNPYTDLAAWIGGADRQIPVEIYTTNYDLLFEEAFERLELPFLDGFSGCIEPFCDPASISSNDLPARWTRLWKLHGSLGWANNGSGRIVRGKGREHTQLIYPDHLNVR